MLTILNFVSEKVVPFVQPPRLLPAIGHAVANVSAEDALFPRLAHLYMSGTIEGLPTQDTDVRLARGLTLVNTLLQAPTGVKDSGSVCHSSAKMTQAHIPQLNRGILGISVNTIQIRATARRKGIVGCGGRLCTARLSRKLLILRLTALGLERRLRLGRRLPAMSCRSRAYNSGRSSRDACANSGIASAITLTACTKLSRSGLHRLGARPRA